MPCGSRRAGLTGYQRLHKIRENVKQALGGPLGVGEDSGEVHRAMKICKDEMQGTEEVQPYAKFGHGWAG